MIVFGSNQGILKMTLNNTQEEYAFIQKYVMATQVGPFPVQMITVDAVVFYRGKLLLIKRKNYPGKGLDALPGGFVNPEETLLEAVIRECAEETGLHLKKEWLFHAKVFDAPHRAPGVRIITHAHAFFIPSTELVEIKGADDAESAFWVSQEDFIINYVDKCLEDHYDIGCSFGIGFLKTNN